MNFKERLRKSFSDLSDYGYFAKQNYACCQSCGWADIPMEVNKVVFYHQQDNEDLIEGYDFYVAWKGDGTEICNIFKMNDVHTEWDGDDNTRIKIKNI